MGHNYISDTQGRGLHTQAHFHSIQCGHNVYVCMDMGHNYIGHNYIQCGHNVYLCMDMCVAMCVWTCVPTRACTCAWHVCVDVWTGMCAGMQ